MSYAECVVTAVSLPATPLQWAVTAPVQRAIGGVTGPATVAVAVTVSLVQGRHFQAALLAEDWGVFLTLVIYIGNFRLVREIILLFS